MLRFSKVLALLLWPVCASAQTTNAEIRDLAYAGDVDGLESAFSAAHQRTLLDRSEAQYEALRKLVETLTVTHPTIIDTTDAWLETYPRSPYAHALRAFQFRRIGFNLRGGGSARATPRDALAAFAQYQAAATEHALLAYEAAPDYVPASDAVFRLQTITKALSHADYLRTVDDVMQVTPNTGSLVRAAGFAHPGWGGAGMDDIEPLCEAYADIMPDPAYDIAVCLPHLAYNAAWRDGQYPRVWRQTGRKQHPAIASAWAYRITSQQPQEHHPDDRKIVEDYLTGAGQTDTEIAWRYLFSFDTNNPTSQEIIRQVNAAIVSEAREMITHDPFNPHYLERALRRTQFQELFIGDHIDELYSENFLIMQQRMAVARPYHPQSWEEITFSLSTDGDALVANAAMPYIINAIFYSDHEIHYIERALLHIIDVLAADHFMRDQSDAEISITAETPAEPICHFVRLDRMATHQCRAMGLGFDRCPEVKQFRPMYDRLMDEALATGKCEAETNASFADLKYDPVTIPLEEVMRPLVWD